MVSSSVVGTPLDLWLGKSLSTIRPSRNKVAQNKFQQIQSSEKSQVVCCSKSKGLDEYQYSTSPTFHKSLLPLAASIAVVLWSTPVNAGFLSGLAGLESVPGPELPQIDFLNRFNEENQKRYAENDARFKNSPVLKQLLERSKLNKEKNKQEIQDKYCIRGAEWGVGDCSADGMSPQDRDEFIAMLKKKAGVE